MNEPIPSLLDPATRVQSSLWDWLVRKPLRRKLSKVRWKVLQRGEAIETYWNDLREQWLLDIPEELAGEVPLHASRLLRTEAIDRDEKDGTTKWLLRTRDEQAIEAVLIPSSKSQRATACISSQVGCGVKCSFCATGTLGLIRNLSTHEILEQLLVVREESYRRQVQLRNVVFMGMGEPLHNWNNVSEAIEFILRDDGFYFSPSHVCVSTAGVVQNMLSCARRFPKIRIAVSIHSCDPEVRRKIVPRGVGSLEEIRRAIVTLNEEYPDRSIWIEVVMLSGVTDRDQDVELLIEFCRGLNVEINLIPYNAVLQNSSRAGLSIEGGEPYARSDRVWAIAQRLRKEGFFTTIRYSGGQSIAAACGQLAANP